MAEEKEPSPAEEEKKSEAQWLTAQAAASFLGITVGRLDHLRRNGQIAAKKVGWFSYQYDVNVLMAYANRLAGGHQSSEPTAESTSQSTSTLQEAVTQMPTPARKEVYADDADKRPIVRMANAILVSGIEAGASDISLESDRTHVRVRIRVDGTLQELLAIPNYVETALINRYLVMAELNPSTRRPQQGVFSVLHGETHLNLRVSYLPILRGSKLAMRLYDCTNLPSVWDLGMSEDIGSEIGSVATYENGLILFVGSPGEGATTTAFAFLKGLNTPERYLCTLEEQMSYSVEGLSQIYWKPQNNLTPQTILPTLLRQDPDILFVGDIDTAENLEFALQVAEQGITVIATLHAPDSVHALFRLMRLGVSSERLQSVLRCICAQRLVRKICPNCKTAVTVETGEITYKGVGCATCQNRGYKGRTAVFEILWMNRVIGEALSLSSSYLTIQEIALANRLRPFQTTIREMIGEGTIAYEEGIAVSYG